MNSDLSRIWQENGEFRCNCIVEHVAVALRLCRVLCLMHGMKDVVRGIAVVLAVLWGAMTSVAAGEATVAVAANFADAAERLRLMFHAAHLHQVTLVRGSTGKLAAQATLGAPFDVLLAADQARPRRLVESGHAVAGSQFTYALGRLALVTRQPIEERRAEDVLTGGQFRRLAIANPEFAPYGKAAIEVLKALGVDAVLKPKLVYGENVLQALAYAANGNTEWAIVAMSNDVQSDQLAGLRFLPLDSALHRPVRQDAVLLTRGSDNRAALEFLMFLRSGEAREVIGELGYSITGGNDQ